MKECFCWQWVLTLSIVFIYNRLKRCFSLSEDGTALKTMLRPSETSSFYSGENNECVCPNTNSIIKEGYQIKIGQFITLVNIGKFLFSTSYRHWPLHCMTHAMKRLLHHPASRSKSITELRLLSSRNLCTEAVVATSPTWSYKFDLLLQGLVSSPLANCWISALLWIWPTWSPLISGRQFVRCQGPKTDFVYIFCNLFDNASLASHISSMYRKLLWNSQGNFKESFFSQYLCN